MPTLGLSMIVKNEAYTLRSCLRSVQGLVGQIVVADTGSTDESPAIAREFDAQVISSPWENDFAKARNSALIPMKTDWILVLDADEELDPAAKDILPGLMAAKDVTGGYIVTIRDYMPGKGSYFLDRISQPNVSTLERARGAASYHDQQTIRLFRNHPEIYFFGRVHELVEYRICQLGLKFIPSKLVIHHFGHLRGPEIRERKHEFYRELGRIKIKEQPDNPFAFFELGVLEYQAFHNHTAAAECFREVVRLFPPFIRAWLYLAMIDLDLDRPTQALVTLQHAEGTDEAAGLRERLKGDAFQKLGQIADAREAYVRALEFGGPDALIESKLGFAEVQLKDWESGLNRLKHAVQELPNSAEIHDRLVKAHLMMGNLSAAADASEHFAACVASPKTYLRAASIRAQLQQWDRAGKILGHGLQLFPNSTELRTAHQEISQQTAAQLNALQNSTPSQGVSSCQP